MPLCSCRHTSLRSSLLGAGLRLARLHRPRLLPPGVGSPARPGRSLNSCYTLLRACALFVAAVIAFAVSPAVEKGPFVGALLLGGFFGSVTYATYDLTSLATVRGCPALVAAVDITLDCILTSVERRWVTSSPHAAEVEPSTPGSIAAFIDLVRLRNSPAPDRVGTWEVPCFPRETPSTLLYDANGASNRIAPIDVRQGSRTCAFSHLLLEALAMLTSILSDLRFALRSMARRPLLSLILILILGVGLGANVAMFSVVDSVLLEPLPYPDADRLVWMWSRTPSGQNNTVAALDYMDYRERNTTLESLAAYSTWPERYVITGGDEPEVLVGAAASSNLFRTLGVEPVIGRGLLPEDEDPTSGNPVVLGYGLWQRRFGGDPGILGQTISLEGDVYEVVGVMPAGFAFPSWAELWRPMRMNERLAQGRGNNNFLVLGRLRSGVTIEQAESELISIATGIAEEFPDFKQDWSVALVPLRDVFVGSVRGVLWILLGAVALVLLVACANVAALLLARATAREGEVAVRLALGASRRRVVRQLLTESVVTAFVGGVLGLGVAYGAIEGLPTIGGESLALLAGVDLDGTALVFMLVVTLATGLLFGLVPAIRAPQLQLVDALKEGHRGMRGSGGLRLQSGLVVGQVALSLVLLISSGLLIRSFLRLQQEELGFRPRGVLTARIRLPAAEYGGDRHPNIFYEAALERVLALPGVEAAGFVTALPVIGGFGPWNFIHAEGRPAATPAERRGATRRVVTPGYFEAMGIPLMRGRTFARSDVSDAPAIAVISQSLAREFFPGEDPVGRSIVLPGWDPPVYLEIVGVVDDVRLGPLEYDTRPTMYWPMTQNGRLSTYMVVRTPGDPAALVPALRAAIRDVDPDVPVSNLRPMSDVVSSSLAQNRFRTLLLGAFAGVALLLAALGLYGVLAQLVGRRTHELGVRIALGADRASVLVWVLRYGMRLTVFGVILGLVGAAATTRVVRGVLFGIEPLDPVTFAGTTIVLLLVAVAAAIVPGWRATRVDPVESLRSE